MAWPLASHFSAMLQNPRIAFRDPELQRCRIEKDGRNQPRPWSGAFAVVYKGMDDQGAGAFAVRVFTTESPERRERYDQISEYLKTRRVKCLVDFEYRDRGIRSAGDGKWYPLILMDWVPGETLFNWLRARAMQGDGEAIAAAARRWIDLVKELADTGIAHGDLQDANVMVTASGELKLVDYDCMCVPALVGRRNLEVGVAPYQHPERNETTHLSLDLDNYSALVIYVALRALAADPSLWNKYVEAPAHDKLLFRAEDFEVPGASPLYSDLMNSSAKDVRELTEQLFELWRGRMDQVPSLSHLTNSYAEVERLLLREQWEAAVRLLNRRGQFRDAPAELKPLIHQAYEHVCRQDAWAKFQKVPLEASEQNDRELTKAWNEPLFAGFEPAERRRRRVAEARRRVAIVDRLRHLAQQAPGATTLAREGSIVAVASRLPPEYQHGFRGRVERARQRVEAVKAVERAVCELDDDAEIVAAWRRVSEAKCESLVDAALVGRIRLAERRLSLLTALGEIPEGLPADQLDRRLLAVWQEELAAGCDEIDRWRGAYQQAVRRTELLGRLEEAINRRDDARIAELLDEPPLQDYPLPAHWTAAVRAARDRVKRVEALCASLRDGDRSSFAKLFDVRLMSRYADRFKPYESRLREWTRREVLPVEKLGLGHALARASLVLADQGEGTLRVRWTWPQQRFTEACILAICPDQPAAEDDPRQVAVHYRVPVDRPSWESGGGSRLVHLEPEWSGGWVVVWATVDLGFRTFFSHPLVLGRLDYAARGSGRDANRWQVVSSSDSGRAQARQERADRSSAR